MKSFIPIVVALLVLVGCGGSGSNSSTQSTGGTVSGPRSPGTYAGKLYSTGSGPTDSEAVGTSSTVVSANGLNITVTTTDTVANQTLVYQISVDPNTNAVTATVPGLSYTPEKVDAQATFTSGSVKGSVDIWFNGGPIVSANFDGTLQQ